MISWEDTIKRINKEEEYVQLVRDAYLSTNLELNVENFRKSKEFKETLNLIRKYQLPNATILDVGSGNGISAIAFSLEGYNVICVEPDNSEVVGCNAIKTLQKHYGITNLQIINSTAENLDFKKRKVNIVYVRQALHHASSLDSFVQNLANCLNKNGLWLSVRDHVIKNDTDKKWFLENHALHKMYGGENAFTKEQYCMALKKANLKIIKCLSHYSSPINFAPEKQEDFNKRINLRKQHLLYFINKHWWLKMPLIKAVARFYKSKKLGPIHNEDNIPGRLYSFIAIKK